MEIRSRIHSKIDKVENEQVLKFLEGWIDALQENNHGFSKEEIEGVMDGYSQYKAGDIVTNIEAERIFEKWIEEK